MHMVFTDEERNWLYTNRFGLPLKPNAPPRVKESIERKKKTVNAPNLYDPKPRTNNTP